MVNYYKTNTFAQYNFYLSLSDLSLSYVKSGTVPLTTLVLLSVRILQLDHRQKY